MKTDILAHFLDELKINSTRGLYTSIFKISKHIAYPSTTHLDRMQETVALLRLHLADVALHLLHLHTALSSGGDEQI